ncbi:flowering time control protein FCA-like isoform X3 [Macadamia integrifolia]|uniref:flowering time control protein FCA-like isoform X3 n=1 Tax=Macadamia integrifolia TaxID=60698 RepID=UPI001C4FD975|nr:flowering time control protein FCA-like isoform X3 [Macadamia integrifolia]
MPSRSSDSPMNHHHRNPNFRSGFSGGNQPNYHHHPYNSPPNYPPGGGGFRSMGGGGGGGFGSMPHAGQKRGFPSSGRGGSPDNTDAGFAKLFVGSVPRTATEEDIRPLFEEHGNLIEVALIKDRRTGQQQGCCFIKYATSEEADRAIRALHNQYTLPGGVGPIQVRYADGERERLGAAEYKLFVGSMNRQATEREVEEIFSPYGRVEDVYIMRDEKKQSRGCGFVKFSHRDMAAAAMSGLNGIYVMRGCDQPLTVRFADPKRPRAGESRTGPTFGGPGFGPRSQGSLGVRPGPNFGEVMGGRIPSDAWHPMSPRNLGPSSQTSPHGFGSPSVARGGFMPMPSTTAGPGNFGGPANGSLSSFSVLPPSTSSQQSFNPSMSQVQSVSQQISPLQKPLQSPHHLPSSLQLHPQQTSASYSWAQSSLASIQPLGQPQAVHSSGQTSFSQALPSQQLFGPSGQLPISQPQVQLSTSSAVAQQMPLNIQPQAVSAGANQQLPSAPNVQQQMVQPQHQASTQLAQMLSQQNQVLQASFQSSQQAFSQLQQQLHTIQPSSQNLTQQQASQASKQQPSWTGIMPQTTAGAPATAVAPSTTSNSPLVPASVQTAAPLTCNWTEHTSPEGYKYYYNSVTGESKWEKPEEFTLFEQQQHQQKQQHKPSVQQLHPQPQTQSHAQVLSAQPVVQTPQMQLQTQAMGMAGQQNVQERGYTQLQAAPSSVNDPARFQQISSKFSRGFRLLRTGCGRTSLQVLESGRVRSRIHAGQQEQPKTLVEPPHSIKFAS